MNTVPQELDWVKARSECSIAHVFSELCLGAKNDVEAINLTPRATDNFATPFAVHSNNAGNVFFVLQIGNTNRTVRFSLGTDRIGITSQTGQQFTVTLTLNNEGKCKLKVNDGEELEQWQVRRMMLEGLFFGD